MTRFFNILTNLTAGLGLVLGILYLCWTNAQNLILHSGTFLIAMVFPITILFMVLRVHFDDGADDAMLESRSWSRSPGATGPSMEPPPSSESSGGVSRRWG